KLQRLKLEDMKTLVQKQLGEIQSKMQLLIEEKAEMEQKNVTMISLLETEDATKVQLQETRNQLQIIEIQLELQLEEIKRNQLVQGILNMLKKKYKIQVDGRFYQFISCPIMHSWEPFM